MKGFSKNKIKVLIEMRLIIVVKLYMVIIFVVVYDMEDLGML